MYDNCSDDYVEQEKNAEFRDAIDALIDEELKSRYEEKHLRLVNAEERAEKYTKLYYASEAEKRQSEAKHKEALVAAARESQISTLQKFTHGYTAGDEVYVRVVESHRHKCVECSGSGEIKMPYKDKEVKVRCPYCNYGSVYDAETFSVKKSNITQVSYSVYYDRKTKEITEYAPKFWISELDKSFSYAGLYKTEQDAIKDVHGDEIQTEE